ncbi:uncharacterized protein LOC115877984 isoform X2 [Sitophilus oryzae]|uniref:Uncharacterized protein LOC115877984 isoform X2 n=1 Tax=Sitophilus oryzae TaxID=7048 RepID=A0A6J2XHL2_SITOR|nr:uncharacterized protein LOC115877984 isoform X2 [Sitophilus oryzae]
MPNCVLKIGGILINDFSSSDSTLSINKDTPSNDEVEKWLSKTDTIDCNDSNLISMISDDITDKGTINSDSSGLNRVVSAENSENVFILNIDSDGFLVPSNPNTMVKNNETDGLSTSTAKYVNSKMLKEFLLCNGGQNIIEEYEKNQVLNNRTRRELVNLTVRMMTNTYGISMSKEIKVEFAKAIVELFPKLRDTLSNKGGYEIFYNDSLRTPSGYLAWRLRTVARSNMVPSSKRKLSPQVTSDSDDSSDEPTLKKARTLTEQEVADIEFLKNACCKTQKKEIMEKMKNLFNCRKTNDFSFVDYPRFLDTPGLIEQDFSLLYPANANNFVAKFEKKAANIIEIYEATISNKLADLEAWDKNTRALLSIIHMLPSTAKGKKNRNSSRDTVNSLIDKLLIFCSVGDPLDKILEVRKSFQPFLVAIGSKRAAIHDFKIVFDNRFLDTGKNNILDAFDLLFKVHFVFKVKFDTGLETFFTFIQDFFYEIDREKIHYTTKMRELRNRIVHFEENNS